MASFIQGFLVGLAYVAPIGLQNMFVINSALGQKKRNAYLTALIVIFFDITLAMASFFGVGYLMKKFPWLQPVILGLGSLVVIWIGIGLLRSKPVEQKQMDAHIPLHKVALSACVVTWGNPQAIIDGTMMLGAFRATLPPGQPIPFLTGVTGASGVWFLGLTTLILLFRAKLTDKLLRGINLVCGLIIVFYGAKLLYDFVMLMWS